VDRLFRVSTSQASIVERLSAGVHTGSVVILSTTVPDPAPDAGAGGAGSEIDVDAAVVRDLVRGKTVVDPDPRGLWLRGARIRGRLDLDHVEAVCPLILECCVLEAGISVAGAHLRTLTLAGCRVEHPDEPAVQGREVRVDGAMVLRDSTFRAAAVAGAVVLVGARIGGCGANLEHGSDVNRRERS
jgi:hypothetical protein